jgi:hypothetical protein
MARLSRDALFETTAGWCESVDVEMPQYEVSPRKQRMAAIILRLVTRRRVPF